MSIGYYQTQSADTATGEIWELLIEEMKDQTFAFQLHTYSENSRGYSESWCEGMVEIAGEELFFKEQIGFHWDWEDVSKQYHLIEVKDGFKGTLDKENGQIKIRKVALSFSSNYNLVEIKEKFIDIKQQLNELLIIKNQYPTEIW
jgi:uncharacterized protein YkvS